MSGRTAMPPLVCLSSPCPVFIRLFVAQERIHGKHLVEAKIQNLYTIFLIVASFFTVVISGSIVAQLPEFIDNPNNILTLLAKTVPQQGVFLSNYVLVNAFLGMLPESCLIDGIVFFGSARGARCPMLHSLLEVLRCFSVHVSDYRFAAFIVLRLYLTMCLGFVSLRLLHPAVESGAPLCEGLAQDVCKDAPATPERERHFWLGMLRAKLARVALCGLVAGSRMCCRHLRSVWCPWKVPVTDHVSVASGLLQALCCSLYTSSKPSPHAQYPYFKLYPISSIIALVAIVYSTLLPLISLFAVIFFVIAYTVAQTTIVYQFHPLFESGGHTYRGAWIALLYAIFLKQFVMTGVFSLFKAQTQAIIEGCSILLTMYFTYWCLKRFRGVAKHGSLAETIATTQPTSAYASTTPSVAATPSASPESSYLSRPVLRARVGPPPPPIIYPSISLSPPPEPELVPSGDVLPRHFIGLYVPPGFRPLEPLTNLSGVDVSPQEDPDDAGTAKAVAEAVALSAAKDTKVLAKRRYAYVWRPHGEADLEDELVDASVGVTPEYFAKGEVHQAVQSSSSEEPDVVDDRRGGTEAM